MVKACQHNIPHLVLTDVTTELVKSHKSGRGVQVTKSLKSSLNLAKRWSVCLDLHDTAKADCEGGGAVKDCVYEAVNQRRLSHASGDQIVQESGNIIKKATQIVIKSRPKVIIRAWEQAGSIWITSCWPAWGIWHSSTSGVSNAPHKRHRGPSLMRMMTVSSRMKRLKKSGNCQNETFCCKIHFLSFIAGRAQHSETFLGSLWEIKKPQAVVSHYGIYHEWVMLFHESHMTPSR